MLELDQKRQSFHLLHISINYPEKVSRETFEFESKDLILIHKINK